MLHDPLDFVGEVLGEFRKPNFDPKSLNYICPFTTKTCTKSSQKGDGAPYPVCTIWQGGAKSGRDPAKLISVCPKRVYGMTFVEQAVKVCWPGAQPKSFEIAREVMMKGFGNVDFVAASRNSDGTIGDFLSIELQAIDTTGSYYPAYEALRTNTLLEKRPTYGINWDNVYKRYVTQLIRKGYFHHHWGSRIVAVVQEQLFQHIIDRADFMRTDDMSSPTINIVFMTYRFEPDIARPGQFTPVIQRVAGTSHANLQSAILYKQPPSKLDFQKRISIAIER